MSSERTTTIVLKAWETYQGLIKGFGENCWKIRSVFYTVSFGLVAAGFSVREKLLYLLASCLAVAFLFLEGGYRRLQQKYIAKAVQMERTINAILAGESEPYIPDEGVSTDVDTPTLLDLARLLQPKRYLFWLSYAAMLVLGVALYALDVQAPR